MSTLPGALLDTASTCHVPKTRSSYAAGAWENIESQPFCKDLLERGSAIRIPSLETPTHLADSAVCFPELNEH